MWQILFAVWIVYGPSGPIARTIVTAKECPQITIDGTRSTMRVKSEPDTNYPVTVCEADIPMNAKSASIDGKELPVAKLNRAEKVAIVGDTGCRMRIASGQYPAQNQGCDNPTKWPFKRVADSIAEWNPDVVLHVGDYYYREAACVGSSLKCTKSNYNWTRWNADFFTPAAKLLENTPWIMVRGNHETCTRAAEGWFRFLETRNYVWENAQTCTSNQNYTPPYVVTAGDLSVAVLDSSGADDGLDETEVGIYANELNLLGKSKAGTWLTLHHPMWALSYGEEDSETLAEAWDKAPQTSIGRIVSGHIHDLELLTFTDNTLPQFVVGNGGTALDPAVKDPTGTPLGGRTVASFFQDDDFGWVAATRTADGWTFVVMDKNGKPVQ